MSISPFQGLGLKITPFSMGFTHRSGRWASPIVQVDGLHPSFRCFALSGLSYPDGFIRR
ncbi:MAG: hypothetical protein RBS33_02225 [Lentimicrobium sp.]|jgi:hypothetical protein|nr:hypothetical protein [Lentimicrobium sp.]